MLPYVYGVPTFGTTRTNSFSVERAVTFSSWVHDPRQTYRRYGVQGLQHNCIRAGVRYAWRALMYTHS